LRRPGPGFHLVEALVVLAITALLLTWSVPGLLTMSRRVRVEMAAHEIAGMMAVARSSAIRHNVNVAVKLHIEPQGRVLLSLYRDGDGDGVLTRDIVRGDDPALGPPRELAHMGAHVRFGFPRGIRPRDPGNPGRRLSRLDDPIRFNRSDMASFGPLGTSTPGSIYLTDGLRFLSAVRVFGRTGKIEVLRYDVETETWE
jgi:hypothetical protein